jgi:hypothetical protein
MTDTIEQQLAAANARIAHLAEENERLTALLPPLPAAGQRWRPGSKCPATCMCTPMGSRRLPALRRANRWA